MEDEKNLGYLFFRQTKLFCWRQSVASGMMELSFAYHVYQFDAGQDGLRSPKRFESLHRSTPTFDIFVNLLNQVVQVLALPDGNRFLIGLVGVEHG
jgi:hypothetical protein